MYGLKINFYSKLNISLPYSGILISFWVGLVADLNQ